MTHAGENVRGVALDLHAPAAAVALLPAPELMIDKGLVNLQAGGHAGKKGEEGLAMRLSRCEIAQHKFSIVPEGLNCEQRGASVLEQSGIRLWWRQIPRPTGENADRRDDTFILGLDRNMKVRSENPPFFAKILRISGFRDATKHGGRYNSGKPRDLPARFSPLPSLRMNFSGQ